MSRPAMSAPLVRITLDPEQSRQLDQAGAGAFSIVARGSYPAARDRWILTLAPAERQTAVAACHVLLGTHRAARIKPTVRADRPGRLATPAANNFNPPMNATPAAEPAHGCGHRSGNHPGAIVGQPRTIHGTRFTFVPIRSKYSKSAALALVAVSMRVRKISCIFSSPANLFRHESQPVTLCGAGCAGAESEAGAFTAGESGEVAVILPNFRPRSSLFLPLPLHSSSFRPQGVGTRPALSNPEDKPGAETRMEI